MKKHFIYTLAFVSTFFIQSMKEETTFVYVPHIFLKPFIDELKKLPREEFQRIENILQTDKAAEERLAFGLTPEPRLKKWFSITRDNILKSPDTPEYLHALIIKLTDAALNN